MNITYRIDKNIIYIAINGRIDASNASEAEEKIFEIKKQNIDKHTVIDADNLEYISSAGLRIILKIRKEEPKLAIINVSPEVYEVFDMTGFTDMVTVEKAYKKLSIDGCEFIAKGANGAVYRYDDETMKFIETRKRVAHMRREEARRKRNIMIAIISAVLILAVIIVIAAVSCGCGSSKEEATTVAPTTVEETTVEETTVEETTVDGEFSEGSKAYVTEEGVHLRSEASTDSDIVDSLDKNTEVTVVSLEDDWVKVTVNDEEGYISKDYLSTEKVKSGSSDDSEDTDSGNSSDDNNNERTIETRKRTIQSQTKSSSSSSSSKKKNTNDKRTLY